MRLLHNLLLVSSSFLLFNDFFAWLQEKLLEVVDGGQIVLELLVDGSQVLAQLLDDWVLALQLLLIEDCWVESHVGLRLVIVTWTDVSHVAAVIFVLANYFMLQKVMLCCLGKEGDMAFYFF